MKTNGENGDILSRLWAEVINLPADGSWLKAFLRQRKAKAHPVPKAKETMERLLAAKVPIEALGRLGRAERYEMCFRLLYLLGDPGLKSGKLANLHHALAADTPAGKRRAAQEKAFFKALGEDLAPGSEKFWLEQAQAPASTEPFGDSGPAVKRLLEAGASARDLRCLAAWHRYEACHDALQLIAECFEEAEETSGLYESILGADPSGKEGRPGSWPLPKAAPRPKRPSADPTTPCFVLRSTEDVDLAVAGNRFLALSDSAPVRVHELLSGEQLSVLPGTKGYISGDVLREGRQLVVSLRRSLALFDIESGKKLKEVPWKWISPLAAAGEELLVITDEMDKDGRSTFSYHLLDAATLARKQLLEFNEAAGEWMEFKFAPDHKRLALIVSPPGGGGFRMTILSWPERQCLAQWPIAQPSFAWAPDGAWIATLESRGQALVDTLSGQELWSTKEMHSLVTVSSDGQWLVTSDGSNGHFSIWNIPDRRKVREFEAKGEYVCGLGISRNNQRLVACCDRRCLFWEFPKLVGS